MLLLLLMFSLIAAHNRGMGMEFLEINNGARLAVLVEQQEQQQQPDSPHRNRILPEERVMSATREQARTSTATAQNTGADAAWPASVTERSTPSSSIPRDAELLLAPFGASAAPAAWAGPRMPPPPAPPAVPTSPRIPETADEDGLKEEGEEARKRESGQGDVEHEWAGKNLASQGNGGRPSCGSPDVMEERSAGEIGTTKKNGGSDDNAVG